MMLHPGLLFLLLLLVPLVAWAVCSFGVLFRMEVERWRSVGRSVNHRAVQR